MDEVFTSEHMVIITSKIEIDHLQWRTYMVQNWKNLMRKNSKLLVLAGIHGNFDGSLGDPDSGLFQDYKGQIRFLHKKFKDEISSNNIQIILEDVGNHVDKSSLDKDKLVKAVKEHHPTLIFLAFCFTDVSILNDILRSNGIYSVLIMSQDQANITKGKYVILDQRQKQLVESMAKEMPKHVFLWGSSGTGKTLMLSQALSMKISHYKSLGIENLNIIVTSYFNGLLLQEFKDKYFKHLEGAENFRIVPFDDLCKELDLKEDRLHPLALLNWMMYFISQKYPDTINILLVDEIMSVDSADYSELDTIRSNIDFLFAVSPQGIKFQQRFQVLPPEKANTLSQQLFVRHRNCYEVFVLVEHLKHFPVADYLKSQDFELNAVTLPNGRIPIWIEKGVDVKDEEVLSFIKTQYVRDDESTTVMYNENFPRKVELGNLCQKYGWRCCQDLQMVGCEDECIVLFDLWPLFESVTRGRNAVIFVTTQNAEENRQIFFQNAINHEDEDYICNQMGESCPYKGQYLLQKVRFKTILFQETKDNFKRLFVKEPSNELLEEILANDEILHHIDKFESFMDDSKNTIPAQRILKLIDEMINKHPKVEIMKMKVFLEHHYRNKRKVTNEVIDQLLESQEVIQEMRIILGDDWNVQEQGAKSMNKIDKMTKNICKNSGCNVS